MQLRQPIHLQPEWLPTAGKQDAERGNGSLGNLLGSVADVLIGPRMPNYPLNTGQAIMSTQHCLPMAGMGEQRLLWLNLVNVQQFPWYIVPVAVARNLASE